MNLESYIRSELFSARKGFEIGSKILYHNGKLGATENFDQIKQLIEKCNKGRFNLNVYLKNKYTVMVYKKADNFPPVVQTKFNFWSDIPEKAGNGDKYVYLISTGQYQKIGIAKNVSSRLKQLQTSNPLPLFIVSTYKPDDVPAIDIEKSLHEYFKANGLVGEWFDINLSSEEFIKLCVGYNKALI